MIHAYDKTYLANAQKNLAQMLDYMVNQLHLSLENAWNVFLMSELCTRFEQGDCSVIAGMSGTELAHTILNQACIPEPKPEHFYNYSRSPEYWTAWSLAYYQWATGLRFVEIEQAVSIKHVYRLYDPYHEMDIQQFVDKMNQLYRTARPDTNLKSLRILAGLTQSMLAGEAQVPLRTIQQYEQRQKDINKAQADTLLRLARVLNCQVEDLVEKIDPEVN